MRMTKQCCCPAPSVQLNYGAPPVDVELSWAQNAGLFVPAQTPLTPAPNENVYLTSGFALKTVKLVPGSVSESSTYMTLRAQELTGLLMTVELHGFCDNASANDVSLSLGYRGFATPAGSYDAAVAYSTLAVAGPGANRAMRFTFGSIAWVGDDWEFHVRRNVDTNPGNFFFTGLLVYGQAVL